MRARKLVALVVPALAVAAVTGSLKTRASRPAAVRADTADRRGVIFMRRGCQECHAIAALGVKAATEVGPDLTFAYADVVNRYGVSLPAFFDEPPGLMGFVLASHLHLTQADRDSIARILRAVHTEHLAEMDPDMPSFPPARARPRARPGPVPHSSSRE
jgi:mono/diheme cytochrome c family protein